MSTSRKGMAGELGFEPRSSVLEPDSLTVELTPPTPKRPLLGLFVVGVLTAGIAELRKLQTTRRRLLVLGRRVIAVLANRALQSDDLAHDESSLVWPATSAGKQLISQSTFRPFDTPRRRVEAPATFIPEIVLRGKDRSGTQSSSFIIHQNPESRKPTIRCAQKSVAKSGKDSHGNVQCDRAHKKAYETVDKHPNQTIRLGRASKSGRSTAPQIDKHQQVMVLRSQQRLGSFP